MTLRLPAFAVFLLLAACGGSDPQLMNFAASQTGPDEFLVAPSKPLETPPQPGVLVPPIPGGVNRADPTPEQDAIVALGGTVRALDQQGIPSSDSGLIAYSRRLGSTPGIRQSLAEEDLEFRRNNRGLLLERLSNSNVYFDSYERFELDQEAELERLRRAGLPTPTVPLIGPPEE